MEKNEKAQQIAELKEKLQRSAAVVICDFRGLPVPAVTTLRENFRKQQCEYKVFKNTLVKLAIAKTPLEKMGRFLEGPSAIIFSWDSPSAAAKIAREYSKTNEKFKIKGGYLEGVLDDKGVMASADLPGKDELRAALLATLAAPATSVVRTLNAAAQNFAYVLDARKRALEAQG